MVTFSFETGAMCQIWASYEWPQAPDPEKWTGDYLFVGSKGMIDVQYRGTLRVHRGFGWETLYTHPPVQQPEPDDYVIATGKTHSVRDFLDEAFGYVDLDWKKYVEIDPRYYRPTEVDVLQGDFSKAKREIGWEPKVGFQKLVRMMVDHDLQQEKRKNRP